MKSLVIVVFVILTACSSQNNENDKIPIKDTVSLEGKRSTHEREWNENKEKENSVLLSNSDQISASDVTKITESSNDNFRNPLFSKKGDLLFYTNGDFSQIWRYNLNSVYSEKLVDMVSSGIGFQVSFDSEALYFRNKARSGKKGRNVYSIFKFSIPDKSTELIYKSDEHITTPVLVYEKLYFLLNGEPNSIDIITNRIGSEFKVPFYYVDDNYLLKFTGITDTLFPVNRDIKFINCKYTSDMGYIAALTASNGIIVLDIEGNYIKTFKDARSLDKLSHSNLVVYTVENDDGRQITGSNLYLGFLNSDKKIKIENPIDEMMFNPCWSSSGNIIAYTNDSGQIKTMTLKINNNYEN